MSLLEADVRHMADNMLEPAMMQAIYEGSAQIVERGLTEESLLELVERATALAAEVWQTVEKDTAAYACHKGCAWCCHQTVMVTAPEVLVAAAYVRSRFPPSRIELLKRRLAQRTRAIAARNTPERFAEGIACGLLEDGVCSIHPARPMQCRGGFSEDAEFCRALFEDYKGALAAVGKGARKEPYLVLPKIIFNSAQIGMATALRETGRRCPPLELTAAMHIALEVPDIAAAWLDDEEVFAAAELRRIDGHYVTSPQQERE